MVRHNVSAEAAAKLDPALTETGVTQAVVLRDIFRPRSYEPEGCRIDLHLVLTRDGSETTFYIPEPQLVLSSPFRRTLQTAALLFGEQPGSDRSPPKVIVLPVVQESGQLNCDTGSPLEVLRNEFGGLSLVDVENGEGQEEDSDGKQVRRTNKKRKSGGELLFEKHCPKLPELDFSQIDDPEWHLRKRRDGDNPFARAWELKEKLWTLFDELEVEQCALEESRLKTEHGSLGSDSHWLEQKGVEHDILGPIAVVTVRLVFCRFSLLLMRLRLRPPCPQHGGFLKSLLTWDNGDQFQPFANAEIRAYDLVATEVDPRVVKDRASMKGGEPLVHEKHDDNWVVLELNQLSMEELAKD